MNNKRKYTLKEIAELAGVSRATVDRVLKGKGSVSKETHKKIKLILNKIDYKPNLIAQTLKKGELSRIAVLMPDSEYDKFWKRSFEGVNMATSEFIHIGINIKMHLFNPFEEASFQLHSKKVLKGGYDGVLVAPVFYKESIDFFENCTKVGLKFATFNTHIDAKNNLCHIGQDLIQSGKIAASLLLKLLDKENQFLIVHIDEDITNAKHMQEKETGFRNYLTQNSINESSIHTLRIQNLELIERNLLEITQKNPKIKGVFVTTSKVYHVADVIEAYNMKLNLVGYDLLDENVEHLEAGTIDFLIYQNPSIQANIGVSTLVDYLVFKRDVPKQKLLPIEIIIKENVKDFLK